MIDTHAHLYAEQFAPDREAMLARAFAAGVTQVWMPNIDRTSVDGMLALADAHPAQCLPMMGLHPCSVGADVETELAHVETWLNRRSFALVGEIGLDFYWDVTYWAQQEEALRTQLQWAAARRLPVALHCRNSFAETATILEQLALPGLRGIFHCFTGTLAEAQRATDLGFLLGIGGVVTYKNGGLDKVLPHVGMQHLVLETDCPYLPPVPHRGKRNETAYLPLIAQRLADLHHLPLADVLAATTANAQRLLAG